MMRWLVENFLIEGQPTPMALRVMSSRFGSALVWRIWNRNRRLKRIKFAKTVQLMELNPHIDIDEYRIEKGN